MAFTLECSEDDPSLGVCHVSRELAASLRLGSPEGIRFWAPEFFRRLQVAAGLRGSEDVISDPWQSISVVCESSSETLELWTTRAC
jgi:hypothetical protein